MTAAELIERLSKLPPELEVCVDVRDIGFLTIEDVTWELEDLGALIHIEDNDMTRVVADLNRSQS